MTRLDHATLLLAIALVPACAPAVQQPARPSENEARNAATSPPSKPTAPNPAPQDEFAPEETRTTNEEPVRDEEPDTCPPADGSSQGPRELTLREPSPAPAPGPELMRRLTVAQKAELRFLGELCETNVRAVESDVEVGCSCCPPFDECGPVRGGRPRGDGDETYPMMTKTEGSFTAPGVRELAVAFYGCEPHSSNWGGTVLYRREKNAWSLAS
ncbi:MAG TPA: hypothetical protein VMS65_16770, partial [Polyangiaceae bacterium]|nr:hypothetical protein [Polyangiaceae bacterium]